MNATARVQLWAGIAPHVEALFAATDAAAGILRLDGTLMAPRLQRAEGASHICTSNACVARRVAHLVGFAGRDLVQWVIEDRASCARRVVVVFQGVAFGHELHVPRMTARGGEA